MSRRFIDATTDTRCLWEITLKDGSKAQCGKSHIDGQLCAQHKKIADKWECGFCGGNDEFPIDHCIDCSRNGDINE